MDQRAAEAELLLHPARELAGRTIRKRIEPGRAQQPVDPPPPLCRAMAEQAAEEVEVLENAEVPIEVLAQSLRHVGRAGIDLCPVRRLRHRPAQYRDFACLHLACAREQPEQRRLAHAVRSNETHHPPGRQIQRDVIQREDVAIAMRHATETRDQKVGGIHRALSSQQRCELAKAPRPGSAPRRTRRARGRPDRPRAAHRPRRAGRF